MDRGPGKLNPLRHQQILVVLQQTRIFSYRVRLRLALQAKGR